MAREWQVAAYPNLTVYGRVREALTGHWRRTDDETFEVYNAANWLLYIHPLTSEGEDRYVASLGPLNLPAAYYGLEGRTQVGAGPVEGCDGIVSEDLGYWNGTAFLPVAPDDDTPSTAGGLSLISFLVTDNAATPAPLAGAVVTVRNSGDVPVWTGQTNGMGLTDPLEPAVLLPGTYSYAVSAGAGYTTIAGASLVVPALPVVQTIPVQLAVIAMPPPSAGLCIVRFYETLNRLPQEGYVCRARLVKVNSALPDELLSNVIDHDVTGVDGLASLTLVRYDQWFDGTGDRLPETHGDGIYEVTVTAPNGLVTMKVKARIPNAPTCDAEDLLPV